MNYAAVKAAIEADLPASQWSVLVVLAYYARRDLHAFCSIPEIAARTGLSDRTVRRALEELTKAGWIRTSRRYVPGRRLCNSYELLTVDKSDPTGHSDRYTSGQIGGGLQVMVTCTDNKDSVDGDDGEGVSLTTDVEKRRLPPLRAPLAQLTPEQKRALMRRLP